MFVLIVCNRANAQVPAAQRELGDYLAARGIAVAVTDADALSHSRGRAAVRASLDGTPDLAVVLGGDGTILRTAHLLEGAFAPILGINFGHLGFLANGSACGVVPLVEAALAGTLRAEERATLSITVGCVDDDAGEGPCEACSSDGVAMREPDRCAVASLPPEAGVNHRGLCGAREFFALNEAALTRGSRGRIIEFDLGISGVPIASMCGDGLVVASATGSTAYSLSAGGPLVSPGFDGLTVVPLAAHSLRSRAIVTAASDVVEMTLGAGDASREASLFIDGEMCVFDRPVRFMQVRRGPAPITLLRTERSLFYQRISDVFFTS